MPRTRIACVALIACLALPLAALAMDLDRQIAFDIPPQDLSAALIEFSRQARLQVIVSDDLSGQTTRGVSGTKAIKQALSQLLEPAGLHYRVAGETSITVGKATATETQTSRSGAETSLIRLAQSTETNHEQSSSDEQKPSAPDRIADTIVVTGTHIKGERSVAAPLITLDRQDIERTGYSSTQDLFEALPQNFSGGQAGASADGAYGNGAFRFLNQSAATGINLRGIGSSSTLVLVNGHRMAPTAFGGFVDVSMIPLAAIERVEILTDGSSAIYGSDAIAGVVNMILRRDYEGADVRLRHGTDSRGDRKENLLSGSLGTAWGTGNAIVSVQRQEMDALFTDERDLSADVRRPATLLPRSVGTGVTLGLNQELGSSWRIGGDALYSIREVGAVESFADPFFTGSDRSWTDQEDVSIAPFARYSGSQRWSFDLNSLYSRQKLDKDLRRESSVDGAIQDAYERSEFEIASVDALFNVALWQVRAGAVSMAAGIAHRDEKMHSFALAVNGASGGADVQRDVTSMFVEVLWPLAPGLELSLAGRWDDYSDFGDTTNPRIGFSWAPLDSLTLRTSYSRSFRAPTMLELNNSRNVPFIGVLTFPVPAGGSAPIFFMSGARADLQPERAKTATLGFDFAPASLAGFQFGATYYLIDYTDRILTPAFDFGALLRPDVYGGLISTFANDAEAAAFLQAMLDQGANFFDGSNGGTGSTGVRYLYDLRQQNAASLDQKGFDVTASYRTTLQAGTLSLRLNATNVREILTAYRGATSEIDEAGTLGNPLKSRIRFDAGIDASRWSLNAALNHYDSYVNTALVADEPIGAWRTVDLSARIQLGYAISLSLSVQNLLDEEPPFVDLGRPNSVRYDAANANPLGRFSSIEIQKKW